MVFDLELHATAIYCCYGVHQPHMQCFLNDRPEKQFLPQADKKMF